MNEISVSDNKGVRTLTLNRPNVFNAFNRSMALSLQKKLDESAVDKNVHVIVLTGAGKAFCAGQDLSEISDPQGPSLPDIVALHYNPIVERLRTIEKPIIAAVNGVAAGAGANIALACDCVIAKNSASFIQAFSKIGLIPDSGGTFFLPRLIGWQKACTLMMTGDKIYAPQAEQLNMIYKAVEDEIFEHELQLLCEKFVQMPPQGLALTKRALNKSLTNDLAEQLALEAQLQTEAGKTDDFKQAVNAFLNKKK